MPDLSTLKYVGATFTPGQVAIGSNPSSPFLNPSSSTLNPEAVRATGSGPFEAGYRQNLATYEGGQFARPGGMLAFNPTGQLFGNPTGAGNAPVPGMPTGLLDQALSGMSFSTPQPQQQGSEIATGQTDGQSDGNDNWKFWLDQFGQNGSLFR